MPILNEEEIFNPTERTEVEILEILGTPIEERRIVVKGPNGVGREVMVQVYGQPVIGFFKSKIPDYSNKNDEELKMAIEKVLEEIILKLAKDLENEKSNLIDLIFNLLRSENLN